MREAHRLGATLALLCLLAFVAACADHLERGAHVGRELPSIALPRLEGDASVDLASYRGRALVVNFWASWCVPCRTEMPGLEHLSHRLAPYGVRVIAIGTDSDLNLAREFARARRLTFPLYADTETKAVQTMLGVTALPETLLVSAEGRIVGRIVGMRDWGGAEGMRLIEEAFGLGLTPRS